MQLKRNVTTFFLVFLVMLPAMLFLAHIVSTSYVSASSPEVSAFAVPDRVQEGNHTTITAEIQSTPNKNYTLGVNVTNPAGASSNVSLTVTTNATGFGSNSTSYWEDFTGANTDLVGIYNVTVKNMTTNETLANTSFSVTLTDKLIYQRNETVNIQASGYNNTEKVTVNIETYGSSVTGYPKNITANTEGVVNDSWLIVPEASVGVYTVTITNATATGTLKTPSDTQVFAILGVISYSVTADPNYIQEGFNTTITASIDEGKPNTNYTLQINVTDPRGNSYNSNLLFATNETGFGSSSIKYWSEFQDASTDFIGVYSVAVNKTLATGNFTVGLTDKLEYQRTENVNIRGTGYGRNENVSIDILYSGVSVEGYPKNTTADEEGMVTDSWQIPINTTPGTYNVSITTLDGTTVKIPPDRDQFEVLGVICQIQTVNLAGQTVSDMSVEVYNSDTPNVTLLSGVTNATGWVRFNLDEGNYTFKAFWKKVEVGVIPNVNATENEILTLQSQLTNIKISVTDEAGNPVPFIDLTSTYNYTTRENLTRQKTESSLTSYTGIGELHNMLINISYLFEAKRYDFPFNQTYIEKMKVSPWFNITITLPTYTAFIHVVDSKNNPLEGFRVEAYEWISGLGQPCQSETTDSNGNVTLSLPFGKYRVRVRKDNILLNENTLDLFLDQSSFVLNFDTYNLDFTVTVIDYFNQPIPNAVVRVEQKATAESVEDKTGPSGRVIFSGILGGDSRVSIYIGGQLIETKDLYLTDSEQVTFSLNRYLVVAGNAVETSQFVTAIALAVLVVTFIVTLTYKRLLKIFIKSK